MNNLGVILELYQFGSVYLGTLYNFDSGNLEFLFTTDSKWKRLDLVRFRIQVFATSNTIYFSGGGRMAVDLE